MTIEEFISRAADQTPLSLDHVVAVPGPELQRLLAERTPILVSELMAHPVQHQERRTSRYGHLLGAGIAERDIDAWQRENPRHLLPADLRQLLSRINGINLWADLATSRAYFGILPLNKWTDAASADWAVMFDDPRTGLLVLSHHDNGDFYLVLDTRSGSYLWYDLEDFDRPKVAGHCVEEFLDFWWRESQWLDPRRGANEELGSQASS